MVNTLTIKEKKTLPQVSLSTFRKEVITDFMQMTLLFLVSVYAVYYGPTLFNYLYFLGLLFLFWKSDKDYFWYGFYFIIINTPVFLFFETSSGASNRLPLYSLAGGLSFSVYDLFTFTALAKVVAKGKRKPFYLTRSLRFLLVYFLLVSIPLSFIIGSGESSFVNTFRPYFYYTLLISFYFLVDDVEDLYRFGYLMVPYVFLTLFDQLYLLMNGELLIAVINPETVREVVDNTITGGIRAYFSCFLLIFYAFLFALQLRSAPRYELFSGLAYLVIFVSLTTFVLSATRAYLMMPLAVLIMYFVVSSQGVTDMIKFTVFGAILGIIFFSLNLISFDYFLENIWPRFEAFFGTLLGSGSLAKFDTVQSRLSEDLPHILEGIEFSPIIGAGFSGIFREYANNDLGFLNTILLFGFVGFGFFIYFLVILFKKLSQWVHHAMADRSSSTILNSIRMVFVGIILGYATTYDFFTVRQVERIFFVAIILASAEIAIHQIQTTTDKSFFHPKNHKP